MQIISTNRVPGTLSFTFDDGVSKNFGALLEILDEEDIPATFFLIGESLKSSKNFELAKKAHRAGHILGNHTWTHPQITKIPLAQLEKEITDTEKMLTSIRGASAPKYFRPPYGSINQSIRDRLSSWGYTTFLWNIDMNDWDVKNSKDILYNNYKKFFSTADPAKHSYISLQHDRRRDSVELVPYIARMARDRGFKIVPLSA